MKSVEQEMSDALAALLDPLNRTCEAISRLLDRAKEDENPKDVPRTFARLNALERIRETASKLEAVTASGGSTLDGCAGQHFSQHRDLRAALDAYREEFGE